jgi:hypothetical protein
VRPFAKNVRELAKRDARKLRFDLQTCLNNVFFEAEFRGHFSLDDVLRSFQDEEDKTEDEKTRYIKIRDKFEQARPKIWRAIGFFDVKETSGEVSNQPMSDTDLSLLESALKDFEEVNRDFLDLAIARAQVLIQRELKANI